MSCFVLFCLFFASGVERKRADSLPGRPGTGEKKIFFFLYNTSPVSQKTWSASLQGLGDLGNWATRLGRALEQLILHSWGGGEEQDGAKWREIENRAEGVEEHLPGVPRLPRLSTVFLEAWVEAASLLS